jgi:hypothetical protein
MEMVEFKVGDLVYWESQAGASWTCKEGKVIKVLPPKYWIDRKVFMATHVVMYDGGLRNHESYLVEVPGGKTAKAKPKLYWPRVSALCHAQGEASRAASGKARHVS